MLIYLAGIEDDLSLKMLEDPRIGTPGPRVFVSYWTYLKKWKHKPEPLANIRARTNTVIIDSGAHSFFGMTDHIATAAIARPKAVKMPDPIEYGDRYLEWIAENKANLTQFVELDIGEIIGQKQVHKWRDRMVKLGIADKCLPVYHPTLYKTPAEFVAEARQWPSRYVGIEGMRGGRVTYDFNEVVRPLYENGIRVHGFAMVRMRLLRLVPFYSVDSTGWKSGVMWGKAYSPTGKSVIDHMENVPTIPGAALKKMSSAMSMLGIAPVSNEKADGRLSINLAAVLATENAVRLVTAYWKAKGVNWDAKLAVQTKVKKAKPRRVAV